MQTISLNLQDKTWTLILWSCVTSTTEPPNFQVSPPQLKFIEVEISKIFFSKQFTEGFILPSVWRLHFFLFQYFIRTSKRAFHLPKLLHREEAHFPRAKTNSEK